MSIYQLDSPERAVVLRFGEYHAETGEGLNFMLAELMKGMWKTLH